MKSKKIWFRAKQYGWGWYPCTWQGWLITLALIAFITYIAVIFLSEGRLIEYFVSLTVAVVVIIYIGYKKGEKPEWKWGNKKIKWKKN